MNAAAGTPARRIPAGAVAGAALVILSACAGSGSVSAHELDGQRHASEAHDFRVEVVTDDLEHPWSLAFLPDGRALVTERPGRLLLIDPATGERTQVEGVPGVTARNQGGLLDVALHPDYPEQPWIYLTWSGAEEGSSGTATHLGRARFDADAARLDDLAVLHVATPYTGPGRHYGSRLAFDPDGYLFMTTGDRGSRDSAQDMGSHHGKTLRFTTDGEIPVDNPFVDDDDVLDAIFSYGHRNAQGMAVHPDTGEVWQSEHGPRAGDEINRIERGADFGWPDATWGREYGSGRDIGVTPPEAEDTVDPVYYWEDASFAPSGLAVYSGDAFPDWQGDFFVGALARTNLTRLIADNGGFSGEETLLDDAGLRIRDVRVGPEGYLHLLVDASSGPWLRLVPAE